MGHWHRVAPYTPGIRPPDPPPMRPRPYRTGYTDEAGVYHAAEGPPPRARPRPEPTSIPGPGVPVHDGGLPDTWFTRADSSTAFILVVGAVLGAASMLAAIGLLIARGLFR
jgi:hypothetical protein